ncbi:hypothetical protein [Streptomyces goshikiensis]|uniref:hypothetical protein n=1 Tax=Streptomyces goshikiensis TaxID=1942 RepID=UPI0036B1931B
MCPPALIALMLRRRLPVTVLLATLPSMATGFLWLAPMAAMYTVASCAVRRRVVVGAGAALFAATLWAGYTVGAEAMTWSDHLIVVQVALMFSLGPAGLGLLARTRSELRAHVAELSASQARGWPTWASWSARPGWTRSSTSTSASPKAAAGKAPPQPAQVPASIDSSMSATIAESQVRTSSSAFSP